MIEPRLALCGGITVAEEDPLLVGRRAVTLDTGGYDPNVNVRVEDVAKVFLKHLSPRLTDLLEVAAYIYTLDAATRRGNEWVDDGTLEPWGRDFKLVIPVRDLAFWARAEVGSLLSRTLAFLSDDTWAFEFREYTRDEVRQEYLQFSDQENWPFHSVERVLMFSGGLDSTAGAVETASSGGHLVLVSHRSVTTMYARQRRLFTKLDQRFPRRLLHVPVWINKAGNQHREATQRTRSFLFAALGTIVAESVGAQGVRFFENGVVSLNIPVADEALLCSIFWSGPLRCSGMAHP